MYRNVPYISGRPKQVYCKLLFTEISLTYQEDQGKYKLLFTEISLKYQEDHVAAANRKFLKV